MELWALENAGVDNWTWYSESISDYYEINNLDEDYELTDVEKMCALEAGGVDNWPGWDFACELMEEEYGEDW